MATTWVPGVAAECPFSLENLPFGIISTDDDPAARVAVAIGTNVLDMKVLSQDAGFLDLLGDLRDHARVFSRPVLNDFAALGRHFHCEIRRVLHDLLVEGILPEVLEKNAALRQRVLIPQDEVEMHLPMAIGDYTDFYAGYYHAHAVGVLFRGAANALQPNYAHLPVGYHGRSSSIVVSGTPIARPCGQILPDPRKEPKEPITAPSRRLDIELELGCFVIGGNELGDPIDIRNAEEHIFGYVLLNDWSARDIQQWEYVPLGPFNGKNFATSISPWVVLADALEPFRARRIENTTPLQGYLKESRSETIFDMDLTVDLTTPQGGKSRICTTSSKHLMWSFPQMIAHHTLGGCPMRTGDLLGSGTISGPAAQEKGSLLEMSEGGQKDIMLHGVDVRRYLEDGDVVTIRGTCGEPGARVGFGDCSGRIYSRSLPAKSLG